MSEYKLINKQTNEEHICSKVVRDGFDYYVNDDEIQEGDYLIDDDNSFGQAMGDDKFQFEDSKKVIATNNPSIDVPKVGYDKELEDVNTFLIGAKQDTSGIEQLKGYVKGYNKSQETHPNSDDDMIEFYEFCKAYSCKRCKYGSIMSYSHPCRKECQSQKITEELLQIWKEQKLKTVYYENN